MKTFLQTGLVLKKCETRLKLVGRLAAAAADAAAAPAAAAAAAAVAVDSAAD